LADALTPEHPHYARILDQRLRNRIIERLEMLAAGDGAVRSVGFGEFFEAFFDFAPYEGPSERNSAMTHQESAAFGGFLRLMQIAVDDTPPEMEDEAFIRTGWPKKIASSATDTLKAFSQRGRLHEDAVDDR
jgi:hypothetical protein